MIEKIKAVDILIFNDNNDLLLQLRAAGDKSFPGHWDFSVGGHVEPSEEDQKAAEREIFEEIGVQGEPKFISRELYKYPAWNGTDTREVDLSIYKMLSNGPFTIDPKEVEKVEFFTLAEVQKMIDEGEKFHPEFLLAWEKGLVASA